MRLKFKRIIRQNHQLLNNTFTSLNRVFFTILSLQRVFISNKYKKGRMLFRSSNKESHINERDTITKNATSMKQQRARETNSGFQFIYNDEIVDDYEEKKSPTQSPFSPRRSLIRQRELWENVESSPFQLIAVSDQYYGENVSRQTLSFLEKMRNFFIKQQQILRRRRNDLNQLAHQTIRERFHRLKQSLIQIVQIWCHQKQMNEISNYTDVTEVSINGSLVELLSKTERRRQEIQFKIQELKLGLNQFKKGHKQSQLYHNRNIKDTVRDVLGSDYELQVNKLREEIEIIVHQNPPLIPLSNSYAEMEVRLLLRSIESQLANGEIFKSSKKQGFIKGTKRQHPEYVQDGIQQTQQQVQVRQYFRMSQMRQKVLQQLLQKKKRQLDIETQRFYNSIIKATRE